MSDEELVELLIEDALNRAIKHYGFEGTIEAIKRVYVNHPEIQRAFFKAIEKRTKC